LIGIRFSPTFGIHNRILQRLEWLFLSDYLFAMQDDGVGDRIVVEQILLQLLNFGRNYLIVPVQFGNYAGETKETLTRRFHVIVSDFVDIQAARHSKVDSTKEAKVGRPRFENDQECSATLGRAQAGFVALSSDARYALRLRIAGTTRSLRNSGARP
jgi:hypothetical protein